MGALAIGLQAVVEAEVLGLDDHGRPLGEGFDEVAVGQRDMAPELGGHTRPDVVIVAFAVAAIIDSHLGAVLEAVELGQTVEVVARFSIEPGGVGADVVAVDATGGAFIEIQI
ncbi:hypothetical protein D3C77_385840 [compost metagenome]